MPGVGVPEHLPHLRHPAAAAKPVQRLGHVVRRDGPAPERGVGGVEALQRPAEERALHDGRGQPRGRVEVAADAGVHAVRRGASGLLARAPGQMCGAERGGRYGQVRQRQGGGVADPGPPLILQVQRCAQPTMPIPEVHRTARHPPAVAQPRDLAPLRQSHEGLGRQANGQAIGAGEDATGTHRQGGEIGHGAILRASAVWGPAPAPLLWITPGRRRHGGTPGLQLRHRDMGRNPPPFPHPRPISRCWWATPTGRAHGRRVSGAPTTRHARDASRTSGTPAPAGQCVVAALVLLAWAWLLAHRRLRTVRACPRGGAA